MWAMMASPLMAGNDIRNMDKETAEILTNKEVIAVDQDELGMQGRRFWVFGNHEIWLKELKNGEVAICFLNRDPNNTWKLNYDLKHYGLGFITGANLDKSNYSVRDLWLHKTIGNTSRNLDVEIPAQGVSIMKLTPIK